MKQRNNLEKQLLWEIMFLRQLYKRRKNIEISLVNKNIKLIAAMTRTKLYITLQKPIDTHTFSLNTG